ncbi:hypothetical protein K469DRAFT_712827 [Zopfia rhizophila CBS 207.26]|uniref:DNA replication regulator Sld3 C-terminal domain-containing protein n=1 Tax=Zopfia rhizophila CBS 207.26 TaxID=1314779 RepID=A0A6A6DTW5_9PEZI|nr:hypothetical protein K469DRAFT_712827 [Zopfia rhizophila CBS 207.26]
MSSYALQTKTMLQSISKNPSPYLGLPTKRDFKAKPQLPSKRKRDSLCGLGSFNKSFVIKPCPESVYDKPSTFMPTHIIDRSQLPLMFLDTSPNPSFPPNRLFSAQIDILEQHHDAQNAEAGTSKVLIARYETNKTFYAIERVQSRVYSLCRLASWLKEKDVADLWDLSNLTIYPILSHVEKNGSNGEHWWQEAAVKIEPEEKPAKRVRMSMLRPKDEPAPVETSPADPQPGNSVVENPEMVMNDVPLELSIEPPSAQQILDALVQQYLDAVYMSKTSLAYFTKGPISRARAAFTSSEEGVPPTYELVSFLRLMLLSHKASEKKYREKLPEVIKSIPPGFFSDEDVERVSKTKKSKKKIKLSRDGMYPQEELIVKKWWVSEMPSPEIYGEETMDQRIRRRVGDLRIRETLAQLILMLEIVALEALSTYKEPPEEGENPNDETQTQGESQTKPKKRKRKPQDIKLLLDLLLDKLCIWQSVDQDNIFDFDAKPSKHGDGADGLGKAENGDQLQSFCVEVIVPFYMSRLPEQAIMINKRLGGPVHISPPKRKAMKPSATSRKSGEPKEPESKKSRRSLGRVATDTTGQTAQQRPTPSLNRSTTDSALFTGIKREGSEVPLSTIPFQRSPSAASRQSVSQFKHLKGREIDLSAPTVAAAAKLNQKKRVEEDLKEAITALKKPNRGLAVGGYVDDIERRGLGLANNSRKLVNPVRKVMKDVQVSATPRAVRRTKDVDERTPSRHRNPFVQENATDTPPSSNFCIPSSAVRPTSSLVPEALQRSAAARVRAEPSVAETPSKGPAGKTLLSSNPAGGQEIRGNNKLPPPFNLGIPSSTLNSRDQNNDTIFKTPSRPRSHHLNVEPLSRSAIIFATPLKGTVSSPSKVTSTPPAIFDTPVKATTAIADSPLPTSSKRSNENHEKSIYDALGWNDDDDLL